MVVGAVVATLVVFFAFKNPVDPKWLERIVKSCEGDEVGPSSVGNNQSIRQTGLMFLSLGCWLSFIIQSKWKLCKNAKMPKTWKFPKYCARVLLYLTLLLPTVFMVALLNFSSHIWLSLVVGNLIPALLVCLTFPFDWICVKCKLLDEDVFAAGVTELKVEIKKATDFIASISPRTTNVK